MRNRQPRCRNCPEPPAAKPATDAAVKAASQLAGRVVSVEGEAERLWNHILFGTGTCVGMLAGYVELDMPGDPLPGLRDLRDRLNQIITLREKLNADRNRKNG